MAYLLVPAQLLVVLAVTACCGWLLRRVGQPSVVGEIMGGLLLGPLVLGRSAPHMQGLLFPAGSLGGLEIISRIGLVLFLFQVGAELDLKAVRTHERTVAAVTAGSILLPFLFGLALAPILWHRFAARGSFLAFSLFIGTAMSITALPVLASILRACAESGRPMPPKTAATALLSASINDLLGWCVLAAVLMLVQPTGGWSAVAARMGSLLLFVLAMLCGVRPTLRKLVPALPGWAAVAAPVVLAFFSSAVTEALGLHAFFGAFLAGLCLPREEAGRTAHQTDRLLAQVVRATLPVFFALTGLRMQPGLFRSGGLFYLLLIVATAIAGKVLGASLMALWSGMEFREAGRLGVLLNTRGLVELIVLNVGYREGVLSAALFTMFVLMALLTTAMTAPVLNLWGRKQPA